MKGKKVPKGRGLYFPLLTNDFKIDPSNKSTIDGLIKYNPSLLVNYYRKMNMKTEALDTLKKMRKSKWNIPVIHEIINTYLYFGDYKGALEYIKYNEISNRRVKPIEALIKIKLSLDESDDIEVIFSIVKEALEASYDRRLINFLKELYLKRNIDIKEMKTKFEILQDLITRNHLKELDYNECKYLYNNMPEKIIFLRMMIEKNPLIKKRYYLRYAAIFGVLKEDIVRILSAKYRRWAMRLAMYYGWLNEDIKHAVEVKFEETPICINGSNRKDWTVKENKIYKVSDVIWKPLRYEKNNQINSDEDENDNILEFNKIDSEK